MQTVPTGGRTVLSVPGNRTPERVTAASRLQSQVQYIFFSISCQSSNCVYGRLIKYVLLYCLQAYRVPILAQDGAVLGYKQNSTLLRPATAHGPAFSDSTLYASDVDSPAAGRGVSRVRHAYLWPEWGSVEILCVGVGVGGRGALSIGPQQHFLHTSFAESRSRPVPGSAA